MKITIDNTIKDDLHTFEIEDSGTVEDLKVLIEATAEVPMDDQLLMFNNSFLDDNTRLLKNWGVRDGDLVILQKNFRAPSMGGGNGGMFAGGNAAGSNFLNQLMSSLGGGGQADGMPQSLHNLAGQGATGGLHPNLLNMDPLSEEYQRRLEENIKKQNIDENARLAHEYNPELYTHITMLYIECSINGNEIQAFVDSGAQSTIMSNKCAERCNLMRLLDTRFEGIAQGVGTSKILGKIHAAQIQIGHVFFTTSITVLEDNKIDMLFGLDNLKRHQCCIDLANNQLTLNKGDVSVPFLSEHEIQRDFVEEAKEAMINVDSNASKPESDKINELMMMGYEEQDCVKALKQAGGNIQLAANILGNMS